MRNFFKKKNKNKGFTLVETLVAISIFTVSILALLSILTQGISNVSYAKKKIIASYLAQEGIEYIRNMRDTFALFDSIDSQRGWDLFNVKLAGASCQAANGCYFGDLDADDFTNPNQPMTGITVAICGPSCPPLLYNEATGKYGYTAAGLDSGFVRQVRTQINSADEIKIFSTVSWTQGSGRYNITF